MASVFDRHVIAAAPAVFAYAVVAHQLIAGADQFVVMQSHYHGDLLGPEQVKNGAGQPAVDVMGMDNVRAKRQEQFLERCPGGRGVEDLPESFQPSPGQADALRLNMRRKERRGLAGDIICVGPGKRLHLLAVCAQKVHFAKKNPLGSASDIMVVV